jgi:hypothetical protein
MARPARDTIQNGVNGWDATINDNLIRLFDRPLPVHEHTGDESDLAATFAAASYDNCLVWVDHTVDGWTLYHSDGSTWASLSSRLGLTFLDSADTPSSYSGQGGKLAAVNVGETALEFIESPAGDFLNLTDVDPSTYSGQSGKLVAVNSGEDGLEFVAAAAATTFAGLSDTPASYSGQGSKLVAVNVGETALEFIAQPAAAVQPIQVACSDESTAIDATGTKLTFRMPYAFTLTGVRASLTGACTTGTFTVDINESGSTILSTPITIDATEKTSTTAAVAAVISDSSLADDAEITIDVDDVGDSTATGLKVTLIGSPS